MKISNSVIYEYTKICIKRNIFFFNYPNLEHSLRYSFVCKQRINQCHPDLFIGSAHVTQDEILNYSTEDFIYDEDEEDQVDNGTPAPPPMTDDSSDDEDEIDLVNPYE